MKKFIAAVLLAVTIGLSWVTNAGQTSTNAYYSGDAAFFEGRLRVITANRGFLELFSLDGDSLKLDARFKPTKETGMLTDSFNDAILAPESGRLYVYASSGNRLYKYDLTDSINPRLVASTIDNSWDWYGRLDFNNGRLVTIGSKGLKVWNSDLQVIDAYKVVNNTNPYNVRLSDDNKFIFNISAGRLEIFDRSVRAMTGYFGLHTKTDAGNRRVAYDDAAGMFYLVDDARIMKLSSTGDIYKSMKHDSKLGYDAVLSADKQSVYVSNGSSIAKLDKMSFKFRNAFENRDLKNPHAWAMGLAVANQNGNEMVVVFDNDRILVLNGNLGLVAQAKFDFTVEPEAKRPEPLKLQVDKNTAAEHSQILLTGAGFAPNETLNIAFAGLSLNALADSNGRFERKLFVPKTELTRTDIKVVGQTSGLSYSLGFIIQ